MRNVQISINTALNDLRWHGLINKNTIDNVFHWDKRFQRHSAVHTFMCVQFNIDEHMRYAKLCGMRVAKQRQSA